MMTPTLDFASLQVRDLNASKAFYTDVLEFAEANMTRPNAVILENEGGAAFALVAARTDLNALSTLGAGVTLWFTIGDPDALAERVAAAGGRVLQAPQDGPFGRTVVVADPDGYALTFHQA